MERRRLLILSLALGASAGLAEPARAKDADLPSGVAVLLKRFQKSPGFSASFVEVKRILLLKEPVTNRGRVYFQRPGTFARYVDEPFPSRVLLRDRRILLEEGNQSRVIDLDAQPAVRALVGGFLALLAGDRVALLRDYRVRFEGQPEQDWKVVLSPRGAPVDRLLKELAFVGHGDEIREMSWIEKSGDSSRTQFSEVRVGRVFTEAEQRKLFTPKTPG
jgi:outer membrane lipoprotein-sorting protein